MDEAWHGRSGSCTLKANEAQASNTLHHHQEGACCECLASGHFSSSVDHACRAKTMMHPHAGQTTTERNEPLADLAW